MSALSLLLLVVGGAVVLYAMARHPGPGPVPSRPLAAALLAVSLLGFAAYTHWGGRHRYGPDGHYWYHFHDIFHYAIGTKYYPELGYDGLYECTWTALQELGEEGVHIPKVTELRSLADPDTIFDPRPRREALAARCHADFSPARWESLKSDLKAWLVGHYWQDFWWQNILRDFGFNPPPTWAALTHPPIRYLPLSRPVLGLLPFVDLVLLFGVCWASARRAWGLAAAAGFVLVLGTNWLGDYSATGGSYARHLWLVCVAHGLVALRLGYPAAAGALLGAAASMLIFPVWFLVGGALALGLPAIRDRAARRDLSRYLGGAAASGLLLVAAGTAMFGPDAWPAFFAKMAHHGDRIFLNQIGYQRYATVFESLPKPLAQEISAGLTPLAANTARHEALYAQHWICHHLVRTALGLAAIGVAARRPPAQAALTIGTVLLFCTLMPASYYFVFLALFVAVFAPQRRDPVALLPVLATLVLTFVVSSPLWVWPAARAWLYQAANIMVFWYLVALLAVLALDLPAVRARLPAVERRD